MSIKFDLDIMMNQEFIFVLQVQFDLTISVKQLEIEPDTVLDVSIDVAKVDSNFADTHTNLIGVGVNVLGDL
jgi:hypothetical protein